MRQAGIGFEACPTGIDEAAIKREAVARGRTAGETAMVLARAKAAAASRPGATVIGCDQILVRNGVWFDKPVDLADARQHLERLRGQAHTLETATFVQRDGKALWQHVETPRLVMRPFSDAFLDWYLAQEGSAVLGSVGAYRLEALGVQLFEQIEGAHSAILGLPLLPLLGFLRSVDMIGR